MSLPRLGIDFGASEIKVAWISPSARSESIETIPLPIRSRGRRVEHPPQITLQRIRSIPDRFRFKGRWEAAIASQRSTFILWDRSTGNYLTPLISWRDRRGEPWLRELSEQQRKQLRSVTRLRPEAGYPLSKIRWFLKNDERVREKARAGELCYGSLDTWLSWVASDGEFYRMDHAQAHETLLFDPEANDWSKTLLREHDVPEHIFPDVVERFEEPIPSEALWPNSRILTLIGDQPAATIGGQSPPYNKTRISLGSAGYVASPRDPEDCPNGLSVTFTPHDGTRVYQALGMVLTAGRTVEWLIKVLGITRDTFRSWIRPPWPEQLPLWCPAMNGVGAPFWSDRPASMTDFREDTSAKQMGLGLMVSILYRVRDVLVQFDDWRDLRLLVNGSLTRVDYVNPLAAAIWDLPTAKTLTPHLTARGALIASHWRYPYLQSDPWSSLNIEVVLPQDNAPVDVWTASWERRLEDWNLTPVE